MTDSKWLESLRALKTGFEDLQRQANLLRNAPADATEGELRAAWKLLAPAVVCAGYAPSAFAYDFLYTTWQRQGGFLASALQETLRQLAGRLQSLTAPASAPTIPSSDFGPAENLILFVGTDCTVPAHAIEKHMYFGPWDKLPANHILRQKLSKEDGYWLGASYEHQQRFGFIIGAAVRDPHGHFVPPDTIIVEDCLRWTILSASAKREDRQRKLWEFETQEKERQKKEEELVRHQRFAAMGADGEVQFIEEQEKKIQELQEKIAQLEAGKGKS